MSLVGTLPGAGLPVTRVPPEPPLPCGDIVIDGMRIGARRIMSEAQHHPARSAREALELAANALVIRTLLWLEARRCGLLGSACAEADLAAPVLPDERVDAVLDELLGDRVPETRSEKDAVRARAIYDASPEAFRAPDLFEAGHILVAWPTNDEPGRADALERARELCEVLSRRPDRFAELARQESACPSASQGGRLGQFAAGSMAPEFEAALRAMEVGTVCTEPVLTRYGYHVIALEQRLPGEVAPYAVVASWLERRVRDQARQRRIAAFVSELGAGARISGYDLRTRRLSPVDGAPDG